MSNFKKLVEARMGKTGENWQRAAQNVRAHVSVAASPEPQVFSVAWAQGLLLESLRQEALHREMDLQEGRLQCMEFLLDAVKLVRASYGAASDVDCRASEAMQCYCHEIKTHIVDALTHDGEKDESDADAVDRKNVFAFAPGHGNRGAPAGLPIALHEQLGAGLKQVTRHFADIVRVYEGSPCCDGLEKARVAVAQLRRTMAMRLAGEHPGTSIRVYVDDGESLRDVRSEGGTGITAARVGARGVRATDNMGPAFTLTSTNDSPWDRHHRAASWNGRLRLAEWVSWIDWATPTIDAYIENPSNHDTPSPSQAAACAGLIRNQAAVLSSVLRAVIQGYEKVRDEYRGRPVRDFNVDELPMVESVRDLEGAFYLADVTFVDVAKDGIGYVNFHMIFPWDSAGVSVLMHGERPVYISSRSHDSAHVATQDLHGVDCWQNGSAK